MVNLVTEVKRRFEREVEARRAEREHTLPLTQAQRYVLRELRLLYDGTDDEDLRRQIGVLEAAFRQPNPLPAVRGELNRIRREGLKEMASLKALSQAYHLHGLQATGRAETRASVGNDDLPRIVCSEALVE